MRTAVLLMLLVSAIALAGCTSDPCNDCACGRLDGNCCGWEFYKPCKLIRGDSCDLDCAPPTRIELVGCSPMDAPAEEAPAEVIEVEIVEEDAVADFGLPPAGR
ncbi:MAG: hypothetical protein O2894_01635 [Planctomycetota bacterium]|nr:hypothetical protein [Planctomycetota bacterium]